MTEPTFTVIFEGREMTFASGSPTIHDGAWPGILFLLGLAALAVIRRTRWREH